MEFSTLARGPMVAEPSGPPLGADWGHIWDILGSIFTSWWPTWLFLQHFGPILGFHLPSDLNLGSILLRIWPLKPSKHPVWGWRNARSVPPPHRRWRRVLDSKSTWLRQILANIYQAKELIFKGPGLDVGFPPLYLSPGLRTFRRAGPK